MKTLNSMYRRFLAALGVVPGLLAGIMALGVATEVVLRNLGITVLGWFIEAVEYGLLVVAMSGTAYLYRTGGHVTVDLLTSKLPPRLQQPALAFSAALSFVVSAVLFVYGLEATIESYLGNVTHFKSFTIREWIPLSLIPFAALLLAIETARQVWLVLSGRTRDQGHREGF